MADTPRTDAKASWTDVLALVAQLDQSGLQDAEILSAGIRVRVSRSALATEPTRSTELGTKTDAGTMSAAPVAASPAPVADLEPAPPGDAPAGGSDITAPMLGVIYYRPAPDEPPFVKIGDHVTADTTVAILEVMKLMNQVTAGVAGTVAEICAIEGQMVEFGDVLIRLESSP